jgi:hypothetical protein
MTLCSPVGGYQGFGGSTTHVLNVEDYMVSRPRLSHHLHCCEKLRTRIKMSKIRKRVLLFILEFLT